MSSARWKPRSVGDNIQIDLLVQDNNTLAPLVSGQLVEALPEAVEDVMPPINDRQH